MIDGLNDTSADADALARLLAASGSHVNCIPMNAVAHTPWQASAPDRIEAFANRLQAAGIGVTVRRNRGQEVGAACGQLAAERSGEPVAAAVTRRHERLVAASARALAGERSGEPAPGDVPIASPPGQALPGPALRPATPRAAPPRPGSPRMAGHPDRRPGLGRRPPGAPSRGSR
jgi:hypothetical protein